MLVPDRERQISALLDVVEAMAGTAPTVVDLVCGPGAGREDGQARWDAWREQASNEPALQPAMTQRRAVFETTYPTEEFSPPAGWQITALRDGGFAEAGVVWRSGPAAVVAAVR